MSSFCVLYGTHRDFTQDQLSLLYAGDRDYQHLVADDVRLLEDQHYVLPEDGHVFTDQARHAHV